MRPSFLQEYVKAFGTIPGWFKFDAALVFMAYNQLIDRLGISGHTLEIGVHHGLSAIAIAALRYFLLKFTRNTVIAFDLQEALSTRIAHLDDRGVRRRGVRDREPDLYGHLADERGAGDDGEPHGYRL